VGDWMRCSKCNESMCENCETENYQVCEQCWAKDEIRASYLRAEEFEAEKSCVKCGAEATILHDPRLEGESTLMSRLWLCNNCHSNYLPAFDAEGCDHNWAITCIKCETRLTEDFGDEI